MHRGSIRRICAVFASAVVAMVAVLAGAPAAVAADQPYGSEVSITAQAPVKQASGNPFDYRLQHTCSSLDGGTEGCTDYQISIDLGDLVAAYPSATPAQLVAMFSLPTPAGKTLSVVGGKLVISFDGDVPLGNDNFILRFTPPNYITPNNTTWDFLPAATSSNADTSTVGGAAKGTATAAVTHTIVKDVVGTAFRDQGEEFNYKIAVACEQPGKGALLADEVVVTDKLPASLEFVSVVSPANPAVQTAPDGTLSWTYDENTPGGPAGCFAEGGSGAAEITVRVRVKAAPGADAPAYGSQVVNTATVSSTDTFGGVVAPKRDDARVTVLDENNPGGPGPGSFSKESFGQLRDDCDPAVDCTPTGNREDESHTTFAGNWLGVLASQPIDVMSGSTPRPNEKTGMKQAGYKMSFSSGVAGGAGYTPALRDPVPCLSNKTGQIYRSNQLPSGDINTPIGSSDLCSTPAFHVRTASVWTDAAGDPPAISGTYAAQVVYDDGTTANMTRTGAGAHSVNFAIPATPVGRVISEVRFPQDAGLSGARTNWGVFGFADSSVASGEIVRNQAYYEAFYKTNPTPVTGSDTGDLLVVSNPQIGVEKTFSNNNTTADTVRINLIGRLLTTSITEDFTVTDLLPVGMTAQTPPTTVTGTVSYANGAGVGSTVTVNGSVEVVNNFRGTGRQLVRITFAQGDIDGPGAIQLVTAPQITVKYVDEPTTYTNTAQVLYPDDALASVCQQVPSNSQEPSDSLDFNDNGDTTENYCYANASLAVPPKSTLPKYDVYKSVRGDLDADFKPFPAVGIVSEAAGEAQFAMGFRNTGGQALNNVVIYDIFPYVGDTGVSAAFADRQRKSQFTPVFNGLVGTVDARVDVAYTRSTNPCRAEVNPGDATCDDDWTTTAPTAAEYPDITGVRLTSKTGESFAPGETFRVIAGMKVPDLTGNPNAIAWNSVAGRASGTGGPLLAISPPKVGITASSDPVPLQVEKLIVSPVDPSDVSVGDTVTYRLSVANPWTSSQTFIGSDVMPAGLSLPNGNGDITGPQVGAAVNYQAAGNAIDFNIAIPTGQTYTWTVKALVVPSPASTLNNSFAPTGQNPCTEPGDAGECATITVQPADLTISKTVADPGGFAPASFTFNVTCTVAGDPITVDPLEVTAGGSENVSLPQGAVCSLVEAASGASTVAIAIGGDAYAPGTPFTVGNAPIAVSATNTYALGGLTINKVLNGAGSELPTEPFEFSVVCTFNGSQLPGFTTADPYTFTISPTLLTHTVTEELPVGANCTVAETDSGEADSTPDPIEVDITQGLPDRAEVTFTNTFSAGTISVRKVLAGDWATTGEVDDYDFTINVTCTYNNAELFTRAVVLKGGERVTVETNGSPVRLPKGAECSAAEPDTQGASEAPTVSGPVTVTAGTPSTPQDLELSVTNTYDQGALVIKKSLTGVGAGLASGPLAFDVACTFEGTTVKDFPQTVSVTVPEGARGTTSDEIGPLPVGATCLTTETSNGGADETPAPVTTIITGDGPDDVSAAEIANAYSAGTIAVTKKLTGKYARNDKLKKRVFKVAVRCETVVGTETTTLVDRVVKVRGGQTEVLRDAQGDDLLLPVGASCWGEETDDGNADESVVNHDADNPVAVLAGKPDKVQPLAITAVNTFDTPESVGIAAGGEGSGGSDGVDGLLPTTGGPAFWLLILGVSLVGGGGGVLITRRRAREVRLN